MLAVVAVIGAVAVAVPFLISSDAVKQRISDQITHWTGRKFTFSGDADLHLFPYLTVRLSDVRLASPAERGDEPFVSAAVMIGKLEILPLFAGRLQFAEFRLVNPTVNLAIDAEGRPNWILDQGVVGTLASKGDSELPKDDPSPPTPRAEVSLGRFLIRGGTVSYSDARTGAREALSDVNVNLTWRSTVDAANGRGNFKWRGQQVSFTGAINAPLTLLAGGDSPLRVSVEAEPAALSFEGMARQFDGMQVEGKASLVAPSVEAFAEWTGAPFGDAPFVGAASIAGQMTWVAGTLNFAQATVGLDGNTAEGALTATLVDGKASVQGTLDFASFDVTPYLAAVSAAIGEDDAWRREPIDLPILAAANFDLRLSAAQAAAGTLSIGPLAASLIVKDGAALFDLGEAHLGGAALDASFRAEMTDGALTGTGSLVAAALPLDTVAGLLGYSGLTGSGDVTMNLTATGDTWGDFIAGLSGTASVSLAGGTLQGIDVGRVPALVAEPGTESVGGSSSFDRLTADFGLTAEAVTTEDLRVAGPGYDLRLAGEVGFAGPTVNGRGVLTLLEDPPRDVPFLVNGDLYAPAFKPDLGGPVLREPERPGDVVRGNG